jgi:transcriptional regulator with XRE-family HTH domain
MAIHNIRVSKTTVSYAKLGRKIQKLRKSMGLTQEEFAEKLNISRTHMGHIEQGRKQPSLELLQRIAKKLGVKVNELIPF